MTNERDAEEQVLGNRGLDRHTCGVQWTALPDKFILQPKEKRVVTILFDLPTGEYDFLAGYGGGVHDGKGIASNLIAFDVTARGNARIVRIKGR